MYNDDMPERHPNPHPHRHDPAQMRGALEALSRHKAAELDAALPPVVEVFRDTTLTLMAPTGHTAPLALALKLLTLAEECELSDLATAVMLRKRAAELEGRTNGATTPLSFPHINAALERAICEVEQLPAYVVPLPHGVEAHPMSVARGEMRRAS